MAGLAGAGGAVSLAPLPPALAVTQDRWTATVTTLINRWHGGTRLARGAEGRTRTLRTTIPKKTREISDVVGGTRC
jgi:hypothetical protein